MMGGHMEVATESELVNYPLSSHGSCCHSPVLLSGYVRILGGYVDIAAKYKSVVCMAMV